VVDQRNDDVTVVITCFNYGQYLPEAIGSAKSQTGGSPRIVVVDDGSSDALTKAALDEVQADPEVTLIRQANSGAAAARNTGLRAATTPYLMALDADDRLPPHALAVLGAALDDAPEAAYAYGYIAFFGDWSGVMRLPPFDPWRLMFRHIVGPTALMRREVFEATGGYDGQFHYEDWELWVHALARGLRGHQVDTPGLFHRKHGGSKFSTDRLNYHADFAALKGKHRGLYGNLDRVASASELGAIERLLYRWVWGPRRWPAAAETALYSLLWRRR
jgi:glycosyltransferase involved in cell wall biosynthesis